MTDGVLTNMLIGPQISPADADLAARLARLRVAIASAAASAGRTEDSITLVAVSKGHAAERGLEVSISARNVGSVAAPYGTGSHPYLTAGAATVDECELELPAGLWQPIGERGIPYGTPQDVTSTEFDFLAPRRSGTTQLDHALTGLTREGHGRSRARLSDGTRTLTGSPS